MTLELIPATLADRADIHAWMAAPGIVERMMGPPDFPDQPVPDYDEFCADWQEHYFTGSAPEHGRVMLLCDGDTRLGMFAYNDVVTTPDGRRACEVDMWLSGPEVCGRGLGPAGLSLLCRHLRAHLDVGQVFLQPSARNPRAIRAYEKAGFLRWPDTPERAARWFSTVPDYADSVFLVRELPPARFPHARVHELPADFDRSQLMPLFALADDSPARIAGYRDQGTLYALVLEQGSECADIAGLVLVTDAEHDDAPELESVAVRESLHDHGLGAFLVRSVLCHLAAAGLGLWGGLFDAPEAIAPLVSAGMILADANFLHFTEKFLSRVVRGMAADALRKELSREAGQVVAREMVKVRDKLGRSPAFRDLGTLEQKAKLEITEKAMERAYYEKAAAFFERAAKRSEATAARYAGANDRAGKHIHQLTTENAAAYRQMAEAARGGMESREGCARQRAVKLGSSCAHQEGRGGPLDGSGKQGERHQD